jgi:hypothetical protein
MICAELLSSLTAHTVKLCCQATKKNKIHFRRRFLAKYKTVKSPEIKLRIWTLDKEIRYHYHDSKSNKMRSKIIPDNSGSQWKAARVAKGVNVENIPSSMFENHFEIPEDYRQERFAKYFDAKIRAILNSVNSIKMYTTEHIRSSQMISFSWIAIQLRGWCNL